MKKQENYLEEYRKDRAHWDNVYENGCSDPCWSDGVNLNLIRNHCIHDLHRLQKEVESEEPSLFAAAPSALPDIPPEVPDDYMAKEKEKMGYYHRFLSQLKASGEYEKWICFADAFGKYAKKDEYVPYPYHLLYQTRGDEKKSRISLIRTFGRSDAFEWWKGLLSNARPEIRELLSRFVARGFVEDKEPACVAMYDNPETEPEPWGEQVLLFQ